VNMFIDTVLNEFVANVIFSIDDITHFQSRYEISWQKKIIELTGHTRDHFFEKLKKYYDDQIIENFK